MIIIVITTYSYFLENAFIPWMNRMRPALLESDNVNLITADWRAGALHFYGQATSNTKVVGAQVAELMKFIIKNSGAKPERFYLVGFSLGAQTAGYAGARLRSEGNPIGRITGRPKSQHSLIEFALSFTKTGFSLLFRTLNGTLSHHHRRRHAHPHNHKQCQWYLHLVYTTQVNSAFRAIWLVPLSRDIKYYSPPCDFRGKKLLASPILSENKAPIWELLLNLCCIY